MNQIWIYKKICLILNKKILILMNIKFKFILKQIKKKNYLKIKKYFKNLEAFRDHLKAIGT